MTVSKESGFFDGPVALDGKEYGLYSWELLEDHPLRSYPRDCFPGLAVYVSGYLAALKKRWSESVFPLVCLFLMFMVVIQFLATLPYGLTYILLRSGFGEQKGLAQWPVEFHGERSACVLQNPRASDTIQHVLEAGCSGVKVDVTLKENDFVLNGSVHYKPQDRLHNVYLDSLLEKLDARDSAVGHWASTGHDSPSGLFDEDPARSFLLFLQIHTTIRTAWPRLIAQLRPFKEKGYLSYRNGTQVVARPVTIVLTGLDESDFEGLAGPSDDSIMDNVMFDTSLEQLLMEDHGSALRISASAHGSKRSGAVRSGRDLKETQEQYRFFSYQTQTATADFTRSIGLPGRGGRYTQQQIDRVRAQVRAAHRRGLRARYEGISCYPPSLRRMIARILVHEGADIVEIDEAGCDLPWWRRFIMIGGTRCLRQKEESSPE
ncbi:hypothetical protein BDV25DRAFT_130458 [Aspergillus avenaceus]|uniref:PLC-like phosphodiesterase n=1 Tax=Aspergillus avenaceus TaxID=36643 RepID=A0A5N6TSM5_ASPAV|nr:hypothetical protein BDV25DRAFT_130458 [Aspergillus avenaceus]